MPFNFMNMMPPIHPINNSMNQMMNMNPMNPMNMNLMNQMNPNNMNPLPPNNMNNFSFNPISIMNHLRPNIEMNNNNNNKNNNNENQENKEKQEMLNELSKEKNNLLMNMNNLINNMNQMNNYMNSLNNIKFMYNNDLNNNNNKEKSFFYDNYDDNPNGDKEFMDEFLMDKDNNKDHTDNKMKEKQKSTEKYKGTFQLVLHCLSSNTLQNMIESFCYDEINSCFYLLSISILSISIFVCDTYEKQFEQEFAILQKSLNIKLLDILKKKSENIFDNFLDEINLYLKCYKISLPWYYSNWNFFYSFLALNALNKDERTKYGFWEYPHKLFHQKKSNDIGNNEIINDKVKITSEKNQNFISDKIKHLSQNKIEIIDTPEINKFDSPRPSDFIKKDKFYDKKLIAPTNSAFNWTCKNFVSYKVKYNDNNSEEEKDLLNVINSKNELCLYNTRQFYGQGQNNDFVDMYKLISGEKRDENVLLYLIKLKYLLRDYQYHYAIENKEVKDIFENINKEINILLIENKNNKEILDILFNIIDENIELIFDTEEKRQNLFLTLYSINQGLFYINKASLENIITFKLKTSFNRINCYKSLYLTKDLLATKPSFVDNIGRKKFIPSMSPDLSADKSYDDNYSDEERFYKDMANEKISFGSDEDNRDKDKDNNIKDNSKRISIQSTFSEINKKKYVGFNICNLNDLGQKIFEEIKNEILVKNNNEFCYYFMECCLHNLFVPNIKTNELKFIIENIYLLLKDLLNKSNSKDSNNIFNLCHIFFLSSNLIKNKLPLNEFSAILNKYYEIFELLCQVINKNIPQFISQAELLGLTPESKKVFEYSLNSNDLNFFQDLNFSSNDLIAVEIELINKNPEDFYPSNKDILLYTNYNSKISSNKRNTAKNNYKEFGTCFLHKISGEPLLDKKIYFLFGNQISISTVASSLGGSGGVPSLLDIKFMASQIPELKGREFNIVSKDLDNKNEVNHKIKIPLKSIDTKLRITCYPFKGGNFYGKGRFAIDNKNVEKQLNCLDEGNYVINNFYKMLINVENKNKNMSNDFDKYKNILQSKKDKDNKAIEYYKNMVSKNNFDNLILINQNKKYYIYDNETNPILNILKYIQNKDHYKIEELNDEVKNIIIPNLRGIDKLSQFNLSLWNIIKNGLYLYTNKDIEFIKQFLNQLAMNIKRKKGTYDMIRNLTGDILDMLDKKDEKVDKEKKNDLKITIDDHITNEVKSMYFNNEAALDEICQVNNIKYEKLGNDVKLKNLTAFFLSELNLLTKYTKYQDYDPEQRKEIENKLILEKSPFIKPLVNIIQKIVILNIFEIGYISAEKNLLKEFLFDIDMNLDNLVNGFLNKYKNLAIKLFGFDLYYNYNNKIKENKEFIYKFLLNDYSLTNTKFEWDLDIDIVNTILDNDKIYSIIDNKIELLLNVLAKDLKKKNITLQIGKIILIMNDIIKLFPVLENNNKNGIAKKSIEILKIIFNENKNLFGDNIYKEFIELFNKLMINITKDIPSYIPEIIDIFIPEIQNLFQSSQNKVLNREEEIERKKNISLVLGYIIKLLQNLNLKTNEAKANESILKLIDVIFSVITTSNKKEVLDYLISIVKTIIANINEKVFNPDFSKIFSKIGYLFSLAEKPSQNNPQKQVNKRYKIIFNAANSELDYGFLVNALYYFEEKFPTVLSRYKLDKKFDKVLEKKTLEEMKNFNILEMENSSVYNPSFNLVTLDPKIQKGEEDKHAKGGNIKEILPFTSYHAFLKNATSHSINPGIARLKNKKVKTWRMSEKVNKLLIELYTKLNEQIIKNQKEKKNNTKLILEIKLDILHLKRIQQHIKVAEKLGEIACLRGNSVLSNKYTYDQVLFFSKLIDQCLNFQIKSPPIGLNNKNPLFVYDDIFLPLPKPEELIEGYTNVIKETSVNFANVSIIKDSLYDKLIEIKKDNNINIINNVKKEYITDEQIMSAMNQISEIIYYYLNINDNFYQKIIDELSNEINKELDKLNLDKIMGILYIISGKYNLLKKGQKVLYNGKKAIISNIYLSKNNQYEIQLIKENEDNKTFEVVSQKMKVNLSELITQKIYTKKLIQDLNINNLIEFFLKVNQKTKSDLLLNIILKILYQANKEKLSTLKEDLRNKIIEIITPKSCYINSQTISELELSFTQTLISKYEKNYKRLFQEVFIPRYNTNFPPSKPPIEKIQNQVLPESEFISCLPQVSLNKGLSCLQNAIIFDKVFVELITNAYRQYGTNKNYAAMSTSQIRSHLLNGNLKSAYEDLTVVFENAPVSKSIFDDNYNPNRVSIEKCIIGKIFLCRDKKLKHEKLVIILLCDFTNRLVLVMTTGSEVKIFWTSYDNLVIVHRNYSSLCYSMNDIEKKFKENLDRLNAAYANKILVRLNQCGNLDDNKEMSMAKLIEWNENCKDNIIYSEIENNSGTNMGNILPNTSIVNNINENSEKLLTNIDLQKYILNQWKQFNNEIKIFNINLFKNIKLNSGSLLPLRRLCIGEKDLQDSGKSKYNQIIISFDSNAFLGPQATLRFYSDEEGTNLLYEIQSIKKEKYGLQSILINNPEVYVEYIPGTTVFYLGDWHLHSRDSDLPCIVAFIPNNFECLMNLTNNLTNIVLNDQNMLKELISSIASNCINDTFPILLQMKLFKLLNNIFNNLTMYFNNDINKYKEIFDKCNTIEEKLNAIGLNKNIFDKFNQVFTSKMESHNKDMFFASPYIIELSNCILNVISLINEPIESTKTTLIEEMKLFNLLKCIKENKSIDKNLHKKITDKLNTYAKQQFDKILLIENNKSLPIETLIKHLEEYGAVISDPFSDIISIEKNKIIGIIIDCFNIDKLLRCLKKENKEEKKEEPQEDSMWECASCHNMNDKDNASCVFCDAPKVIVPPKKEIKKKKVESEDDNKNKINNYKIEECLDILKQKLGNEIKIINKDDPEYKSNYDNLINKLLEIHFKNIQNFEEKKTEIENYYKNIKKDEENLKQINSILSLIKEPGKQITLSDLNKLFEYGIDIYLDLYNYDKDILSLDKINNLGKIIFSIQKLPNALTISNLIQTPSIFRSKEILRQNETVNTMTNGEVRYYLSLISEINDSFSLSAPLLRPPVPKKLSNQTDDKKDEYSSLSTLMTSFRYIISPKIKNELIQNIISLTEYEEDLIQIPSFNVERLNDDKTGNNKNNSGDQLYKKFIIKTSRKPGGELIFQKVSAPPDTSYKNMTEFNQVYEQYLQVDPACFRVKRFDLVHVAFKIKYLNELVQGLSGPYRQFYSDIVNELENSDKINLLCPTQNNVNKKGEYKDKYTINPKSEEFSQFEFLGILMGLCIRTGVYLPVNLCSLVWKKIIGEKVNKNDVFMFDEGLSKMGEILFMKNNEITKDLILNSFGESISSISLTDGTQKKLSKEYTCDELFSSSKTRIALFQEIHNIRLNESNSQIISIIKGINKIIPMSVLQYFTWEEMERLVCGKKTVDIELLEKNTIISPELEAKNYLVKWVWEIVKEFSEEERIQFVKFCYAQERLPYSQEEYDQKQIQFTIKFNANFSKDGLPRADTCFFFLILPDYSSKEIMKKMISIAIKMDNVGMNGDKVNNENNRRLDRRMFSRFDDDNYYDDDNL